ncbi:MAG: phosphate ABC transporter substrate-binding protein [Desulfonatronovibrionaceae bacterium]
MKRHVLVLTLMVGLLCSVPAWAGKVVVKGSTTVLPIAQKVAESFTQETGIKVSVSGGGSGNGIKALIDGSTDVADASRFIKQKEVKRAVDNGHYPVPFGVAYDSIIPVVHPSNSISDLSTEELKKIYKGEITNWSEVGGPDRKVVVISRDTSSGTYETWDKKVMGKDRVFSGASLQASNGAVSQAVSKNKNAIGYVGIGYLNDDLKGLTVEGIEGTKATTLSGEFPVSRTLFMFTDGWPEGDTLEFINYVMHPDKGQKFVDEVGYVSIY